MTTLTAHSPRLPEHCPHKLPTSCRMTAPQCCACSDKRPHSLSYSKYIDGIGFVSQGSRHQNYCSYCTDFWTARIAASDLSRSSNAQIPRIPDQTAFIERWFEWHQGYTYVTDEHGNQELRGLIGERLDQVPPGYLPRTIHELNANRSNSSSQHIATRGDSLARPAHNTHNPDTFVAHHTIGPAPQHSNSEDRLANPPPSNTARSPHQTRQIVTDSDPLASLRQELERIRTGIEQVMSSLRDLGEVPPNSPEALRQSGVLDNRIQQINGQLDGLQQTRMSPSRSNVPNNLAPSGNPPTSRHEAANISPNRNIAITGSGNFRANIVTMENRHASARAERENAFLALQSAENEVQAVTNAQGDLLRRHRDDEATALVFGTREEVERQGADYESPVGEMFTRAFERYRAAEDTRQGERAERISEQAQTSNRAQQRPQEVRRRLRALPEAGGTNGPSRPIQSVMPFGPLPPNFSQNTTHTTQHLTRGLFSGLPQHPTPTANNLPAQRPPPFSSMSQHLTSQADTTAQAQPRVYTPTNPQYTPTNPQNSPPLTGFGADTTVQAQYQGYTPTSPHYPSTSPHYTPTNPLYSPSITGFGAGATLPAYSQDYRPTSPHFPPPIADSGADTTLQAQSQRYTPSIPQYPSLGEDSPTWRERMLAVESSFNTNSIDWNPYSQSNSRYTTRPPNITPRHDPSTTIYPPVGPVIPLSQSRHATNFQTANTPSQANSSDRHAASYGMPDFSTISSDAARMQGVASQAQRRIVRDIRARRHGHLPTTTSGHSDNRSFTLDAYDPAALNRLSNPSTHGSRSEDSASDSGDVTALMDRLRRRRNAVGEIDDTRPSRLAHMTSEAVEATIANIRARRQAGLSAAIDDLLERGDAGAEERGPRGLDRDDGRPEPRSEEEMMVNMECKICFSQLATVAVLPCGEWMLPVLLLRFR